MGWGGRESAEETSTLEKTIYFQRRENHSHKEYDGSMPIYQMSLFRMPKVVARRLEKLQRDFLWGGGNLKRKAHLVNWRWYVRIRRRVG